MDDYDMALAAWFPKALRPQDAAPVNAEDDDIFGGKAAGPDPAALARVEAWVRQRFKLTPENVVSVAEVACQLPGCPPLETAVSFWEGEIRYHFKVLKRVAEVEETNIPFAWLKDTLIVTEGFGCECC